jgi:hypothetical protein
VTERETKVSSAPSLIVPRRIFGQFNHPARPQFRHYRGDPENFLFPNNVHPKNAPQFGRMEAGKERQEQEQN